jgi:hypothetical protein
MASVARTRVRACAIGGAGLLMASLALAQTPVQPRDPNLPDPKTTIPEKIRPGEPDTTGSIGSGENLSDRLSRSEGVIKPRRGIDPEMKFRRLCRIPGPLLWFPRPAVRGVISASDRNSATERSCSVAA